jgi:hypothetical protein
MRNVLIASGVLLLILAGLAHAEDPISCKGSVTSKQGEGLVVKSFRFDVSDVTGGDMNDVLEKCKKIVQQRQNKAGRANPAVGFRKFSDLDLDCTQGPRKFQVRRTLQTGP